MWLCLNNSFLSIVDKADAPGCLLVRARRHGDIERVFPKAKVVSKAGSDYLFRAEIPRAEVAKAMSAAVKSIDYDNFKNSVADRELHDAYARFWGVMAALQPLPPYQYKGGTVPTVRKGAGGGRGLF